MFLLFGMRVVLRTIGEGTFHCPREGADRTYLRRRARRWFTLFFVPIIPLGTVGEVVECSGCRSRFATDVLDAPTSGELAERLADAMRTLVVALLRLPGAGSPAQRQAAVGVLHRYLPGATDAWLDADLTSVDTSGLEAHLQSVGPLLEAPGREALLGNGAWVAAADGALVDGARALLEQAGAALGMTPAHVRGTIDSALDAAKRNG